MDNTTKNERDLYAVAAKKSAVSRSFDRFLLWSVSIVVIGVVGYTAYFQFQYQEQSRAITRSRNEQLKQILQSNEETKALIRCAVESRNTDSESNIAMLEDCKAKTVRQLPDILN